ncbi:hypothetical protein [Antricoccus suffuscus]|nr:hypothetical protein [Antricoccus suffuscus]
MLIDCKSCQAVPAACEDCVVTVLLGPLNGQAPSDGELDATERRAFDALVEGGVLSETWRTTAEVTMTPRTAPAGSPRRWRSTA